MPGDLNLELVDHKKYELGVILLHYQPKPAAGL